MLFTRAVRGGGEAAVFDAEVSALRSRGHDVLVLEKMNREFLSGSMLKKLVLLAASVFNVGAFVRVWREVRRFRPDVAVVHNAFPLWSTAAYLALLARGIPIVQVAHSYRFRCINGLYFRDGAPCTLCESGHWWHGVRYGCVRDSRIWSLAYAFITQSVWPFGVARRIRQYRVLSEFSRARHVEMGIPEERVQVIPNFAPELVVESPKTADPTWVYIGNLGAEKGIHVAVEAFALGTPGKLIVFGGGRLEEQLRERIERGRLPVELRGYVESAERFQVLGSAWGLIYPSLCFENGPVGVLEALSLGVPVVGSDHASIREYVQEGVGGRLFRPGDAGNLAQVLTELAGNPEERRRLGQGALTEARTRFSRDRVIDELEALLTRVAGGATKRNGALR